MSAATSADHQLVTRLKVQIAPDPARVISSLFVPGEEVPENESRTAAVIERVMALTDVEVDKTLTGTIDSYADRHRDLRGTFAQHFESVAHRIGRDTAISEQRRLLIGAYFSHEFSIEGAALCNPSMVTHPDQSGLEADQTRFVLSARAIGEGHLSCIEFRTGVFGPNGQLALDPPSRHAGIGRSQPREYSLALFGAVLSANEDDNEVVAFLHRYLPAHFNASDLERVLAKLPAQLVLRQGTHRTIERIRWVVACNYDVAFPADTELSERILWPIGPTERRGMEDARFVRFTDEDGSSSYYGTYTAYDGATVAPQLLHTTDFRTFRVAQLVGSAAANKGLALFPRKVDGSYVALSRWDRESTAITTSPDSRTWSTASTIQTPKRSWELIQIGNCGSPIETDAGWLVLTHGVGPMRTYCISAILLDLEHPDRVIASLDEPLIVAAPDERDGYVPNVVYSCGAMRHQDTLVIPYGFSDAAIGFATVPIPELLERMSRTEVA